jgi:hypothetical protein
MPLTRDASKNISELSRAHPEWSRKRRVAAGLNAARQKGASIPLKAGKLRKSGGKKQ